MRNSIVILLLFYLNYYSQAQNVKIDSINKLIAAAATDTARIHLLVEKMKLVKLQNYDSSILIGERTLAEAQNINYYRGIVDLRQNLIGSYCFKGDYKKAEESLKFLQHFIKPSPDSSDYASLYSNFGLSYSMQSKYDLAIPYYENSIRINKKNNNKAGLSVNYTNLAIAYEEQSNFSLALQYLQNALKIGEELGDETDQAYTLVNIANVYSTIEDYARAESTYKKTLALAQKHNLVEVELYAYNNLSSHYSDLKKWAEAYQYAMKADELARVNGDQGIRAASLSKASLCLSNLGKLAEAIEMSKQAIAIADSSTQPYNRYQANTSMGWALSRQEKYSDAILFYEKGFDVLKGENTYEESTAEAYNELSECYEKTGAFSQALAAYKQYFRISDSIRSKNNIRKSTELIMKNEFDKKQQVAQAEQDQINAAAQAKQIALLVGLALVLVLAIVIFKAYTNKQKAHKLLQLQKKEVEVTLGKLKDTQAQLIQSEKMASLGELTAGIAHEIQNPLNFVNNFSEVNTELIEELKSEKLKAKNERDEQLEDGILDAIAENEQKINHHGKRADAIVRGMLQHSRASSGTKELTDINALANEYLRLSYQGLRAKDKSFNARLQTDFDNSVGKVNIIPQDIGRVLLNLYNNAFYSVTEKKQITPAGYEPTVSISTKPLKLPSGSLAVSISVKDNGMGIPQKVLDKIYQPFFTTKPTGQGTGLGLSLSYDVIKTHGGDIKVETGEGEGAAFIITLPVI